MTIKLTGITELVIDDSCNVIVEPGRVTIEPRERVVTINCAPVEKKWTTRDGNDPDPDDPQLSRSSVSLW